MRALEGLELPPRAAASLAALRRVRALVSAEIAVLEREIQQLAARDPVVTALQRIPGPPRRRSVSDPRPGRT